MGTCQKAGYDIAENKRLLNRLKTSVMTPAQIRIKAKSLINGANSDIANKFFDCKIKNYLFIIFFILLLILH